MFKITNWGAEITNAKSILGGICYYRYFNENNNDITASGYFPATLGLKVGDRIWAIPSDTDSVDELYVVTAVSGGVPTVEKASGGSADLDNVIETTTQLPAAESEEIGKVYMYIGNNDGDMAHGSFYELVPTQSASAVAFTGNIISSWDIADFVSYMHEGGDRYNEVVRGSLTYDAVGGLWDLVGYDTYGRQVLKFHEYTEDLQDFGCVFVSETHEDGDTCNFTLTTTVNGKKWQRLDVMPLTATYDPLTKTIIFA